MAPVSLGRADGTYTCLEYNFAQLKDVTSAPITRTIAAFLGFPGDARRVAHAPIGRCRKRARSQRGSDTAKKRQAVDAGG